MTEGSIVGHVVYDSASGRLVKGLSRHPVPVIRLARIENGNFKAIGKQVNELRFFFGAGLRIYYTVHSGRMVLLLAGGDKSSQSKDIERAIHILKELDEDYDG